MLPRNHAPAKWCVAEILAHRNLALLRRVPRDVCESAYGVHEKRGRQTMREFVVMGAAHDLKHLLQIQRILAASSASRRAQPQAGTTSAGSSGLGR